MDHPQEKCWLIDMDQPDVFTILGEFRPSEQSSNDKACHIGALPDEGV